MVASMEVGAIKMVWDSLGSVAVSGVVGVSGTVHGELLRGDRIVEEVLCLGHGWSGRR